MNFTIKELNELIYSLGTTASKGMLVDKELNSSLLDKLYGELNRKLLEKDIETLIDSIDKNSEPNDKLKQAAARYSDEVRVKHIHIEEDAFTKVLKSNEPKKQKGWITQAILDYVDNTGASSYKELNEFYRFITGGSNSFSHHVYNLITPYKNRPTRRYLIKNAAGKYEVRVANESNWVMVDSNYRTFNEAPYGR